MAVFWAGAAEAYSSGATLGDLAAQADQGPPTLRCDLCVAASETFADTSLTSVHGNPLRYTDPTGEAVPLLFLLGMAAVGGEVGFFFSLTSQGVEQKRAFYEPEFNLDTARSAKATAGGALLGAGGVAFGPGVAVAGYVVGAGTVYGEAYFAQGKSPSQVVPEDAIFGGGASASMGPLFGAGLTHASPVIRVGTGVVGTGMSMVGGAVGANNVHEGLKSGDWGRVGWGTVEFGTSLLGATVSLRTAISSAPNMFGYQWAQEGLGSNFGSARWRKRAQAATVNDDWGYQREWMPPDTGDHSKALAAANMALEGRAVGKGQAAAHMVPSTGAENQWAPGAHARKLLAFYRVLVDDAANGIPLNHPQPHNFTHRGPFLERLDNRLISLVAKMTENGRGYRAIRSALRRELRQIGREVGTELRTGEPSSDAYWTAPR